MAAGSISYQPNLKCPRGGKLLDAAWIELSPLLDSLMSLRLLQKKFLYLYCLLGYSKRPFYTTGKAIITLISNLNIIEMNLQKIYRSEVI